MKKLLLACLCGFLFNAGQARAQTFKQQFHQLVTQQDSLGQIRLLEKWEDTDSNDPELYVAYFNYYVKLSASELLHIGNNPNGKEALELHKEGEAGAKPAAYMYSEFLYANNLLEKGFDYIDKGIAKFPDRLDMRFGKIYMLGKLKEFEPFTQAIVSTINHSQKIQNKWLWTDNKPLQDPKDVMLDSVQDYVGQLYNTGDDNLLDNMKVIAETVLQYYPNHVQSLSNISIVYMIKGEHDKALAALLKAEKLDPKDYVVLGNIAQAYTFKGDRKNAIKYYELTAKHGDASVEAHAKEQIQALKK